MFLTIIALLLVADFILFAFDKYVLSFIVFVAVAVGATVVIAPETISLIETTGWTTIVFDWIPKFLAVGAVVALIKWIQRVVKVRSRVKEMFTEYKKQVKSGEESPHDFTNWLTSNHFCYYTVSWDDTDKEFVKKRVRQLNEKYSGISAACTYDEVAVALAPQAKQNIGRITFWLLQWPIVIISMLFEDLLFKLGKHLATLFDALFSKLSAKIVGGAFSSKD